MLSYSSDSREMWEPVGREVWFRCFFFPVSHAQDCWNKGFKSKFCLLPHHTFSLNIVLKTHLCFSNCNVPQNQMKGLLKQILGSHPQSFGFSRSGMHLRICTSNQHPYLAIAARWSGITFWDSFLYRNLHAFLLRVLGLYTTIYAFEVICFHYVCVVEILYNGVLLRVFSQLSPKWYHLGSLKSTKAEISKHYKINTPPHHESHLLNIY